VLVRGDKTIYSEPGSGAGSDSPEDAACCGRDCTGRARRSVLGWAVLCCVVLQLALFFRQHPPYVPLVVGTANYISAPPTTTSHAMD
jgi:hypothetical protein